VKRTLRNFSILLVLMMILVAVGCSNQTGASNSGEDKGTDNSSDAGAKLNLYLAGSTPGGGGVWDMIGAGLAEAIMQGNEGVVTVIPGGGVSDVPVVSKGEAELGLTHSSIAAAGNKGIAPFEEKFKNVKAITSLYTSKLQFVIDPAKNISSVADIKEEQMPIRLAVGDPGSTGELATRRLLEANGISYEDINSWGGKVVHKDMSEAATMYGDGLIDAFTLLTLAPNGPMQQVAANNKLQLLEISDVVIKKMVDEYGYAASEISGNAYDFLDKNVKTFSSQVILITNDERPEEEIYNVTKALVENLDYIHSIHSNLGSLTEADMAAGTGVDIHPGAKKYYQEIGVIN